MIFVSDDRVRKRDPPEMPITPIYERRVERFDSPADLRDQLFFLRQAVKRPGGTGTVAVPKIL